MRERYGHGMSQEFHFDVKEKGTGAEGRFVRMKYCSLVLALIAVKCSDLLGHFAVTCGFSSSKLCATRHRRWNGSPKL